MNNYGLQSAKTLTQNTAILTRKSTGCIGVYVRISQNAKIGDKATINFNWNVGGNPDLNGASTLGTAEIEITGGAAPVVTTTTTPTPVATTTPAAAPTPSAKATTTIIPTTTAAVSTTARSGAADQALIVIALISALTSLIYYVSRKRFAKNSI
jgi:hypothetical protein